MRSTPAFRTSALLAVSVLASAGCSEPNLALGDINDLYVATSPETWGQVGDTIEAALQPTIQTVADELIYDVVHIDPTAATWSNQRKLRQLLLIGTASDPWIREVLESERQTEIVPPALVPARDVWARNQRANALVLASSDQVEEVVSRLDELRRIYDDIYRDWTMGRMWASGADTELAQTLASDFGFSLMLPDVYQWEARDSTTIFRNDNPDPSELIRQIHVTWRSPVPETGPTTEEIVEWRQSVSAAVLDFPHDVDLSLLSERSFEHRGNPALEVQAAWRNPPEAQWPAGGPFISRVVTCREQGRTYLLDAWLYAPGRDKYEYMIQLQTILDSFRCDGRPSASPFAENAA